VPQGCKIPFRRRLSQLFDDDAPRNATTRLFNLLLALLIIVNVITVIFETVEPIRHKFEAIFATAEHVATTIFAVEYVLRVGRRSIFAAAGLVTRCGAGCGTCEAFSH
jgi:voltage-gated potassium channel